MSRPPRLTPLSEDEWSEAARAVLEPLRRRDGSVLNIFATLARHPRLLESWLHFGTHVLGGSTLEPRERELAILRTGWLCGSEYEWGQHVEIGRRCGVDAADLERLRLGPEAAGWSGRLRALLRATDELHAVQDISDETWDALCTHYDEQQRLDLVFTVGQYTLVSMALRSLRVPLDAGIAGFPPDAPAGGRSNGAC